MQDNCSKNSRTQNVLSNSKMAFLCRVVTILSNFIIRTIFIRTLGTQYTGVQSVFTDILSVLSLAELGFGEAISFALYKPLADGDKERVQELLGFFKLIYSMIAGIVFVCGFILMPFLPYFLNDISEIDESIYIVFFFYILKSALSYLLVYRATFLIADQKSRIIYKVDSIQITIKSVIQCVLMTVLKSFYIFLITDVLFTVGRNIYISYVTKKINPNIDFKKKYRINIKKETAIVKNVFATAMYKVSNVILHGTDSIIISSFVDTAAAGILSSFRLIPNSLQVAYEQILLTVTPSLGNLLAGKDDEEQATKVFNKLFFVAFWLAFFSSVSLFVLLNPFAYIIWFSKNELLSMFTIGCIVMNTYLACLTIPFQSFRTSAGLFVYGKYRPVIMAALNIVISLALVKPWGYDGVLVGTISSRLLTQTWFDPYLVYKRVLKKNVWKFYLKFFLYSALTIACCLGTNALFMLLQTENKFINLGIGAGLCLLIPNIIIIILFHRTEEFCYLKNLAKRKLK